MNPRYVEIARQMLSLPTAPFHEDRVVQYVRAWARRLGLPVRRDAAGNVFVRYRKAGGHGMRWVFAAHMDHPGFVVRGRRGRRIQADFIGGVRREYFAGAGVRLFAPAGELVGRIRGVRKARSVPWLRCGVELERPADVPPGTLGMWDFPALRIRGRRWSSRGCDDVAGCAAVLCAMEEIVRAGKAADVTVLLTRAEEAGLLGAMGACRAESLPKRAILVAIETSKAQPLAPLGGGAVIRVGDRVSIFDPATTAHLTAVAQRLAQQDKAFRYVRQLMPGGTCESTVFAAAGYTAGALCLPLGNYHNMGPAGRIAPEQIDAGDFASLVKLLAALPADPEGPAATQRALRERLDAIWKQRGMFLDRRI